ncbi:transcription factor Dp isoform X2 [Anopheles arabiensis]|nr:transcription factor Dp isoform X2 [Anopheles arabiensis]
MKSFVTKDIKLSGLSNHRKEAIGLSSDSFVDTASNVSSTAVIGGQNFTMPLVRKLSPGQKIIPVGGKPKLFLPTSPSNKNANGKVVLTPKVYKVISTSSSSHSVSRNLTFSPSANSSLQTNATAGHTNNTVFAKTLSMGASNRIPSSPVMTKSSSLTVVSNPFSTTVRYNGDSKTASILNKPLNTISEIVSLEKGVTKIATISKSYSESGNDSPPYLQLSSASAVKSLQSNHSYKDHQQQQHSYSKKTSTSQIHTPASRRQKADKAGRGLRHFSMKVCEKVKAKGTTTYNEVANELVAEETQNHNQGVDPGTYDQKNIRRRVYDALNVLMAMKIISKEKKEIRWHGLPTSNTLQECEELEKENEKARRRIEIKQQQLLDLVQQHVALKSLIARNKANEERGLIPNPNSAVQLPFIIVNTDRKSNINCNISNDKSEYSFKFEDSFEIHDDVQILKRIGLSLALEKGHYSETDLKKIKSMVPKAVEKYIDVYGLGFEQDDVDDWEMSSLYNGPDNDDSLSTQDMLAFNDTTNDMLDDEMKFEDDEDD